MEGVNEYISITLVANAGVCIECDGVGLLVDGIHNEGGHPFSRVSEADMERMRQGIVPFTHLDYLLFTHEHPDHFTPQYVLGHILNRPVKGLFLPSETDGSPNLALLLDRVRELAIPYWTLGLEPGTKQRFELADDVIVTAIGARHMGPQYATIRNDCFLLTVKGMNLLFTGDADHVAEYYAAALTDVTVDVAFVNPIFYNNKQGQQIINEIFRPRDVVIYHMPFAEDDTMHFSSLVRRDVKRYARPGMQTHVLSEANQALALPVPTARCPW
ncbi:hypothetical protein PSDVSF_12130 [Pseudodesulfovibrio sediminis]|uniref:Metallo-beta-lactamase domain-containing protein n=1 Tax=Pseudodesulfovibrio sediminis TaxID=2810563 RepID=A0ABN6ESD2_9BACT|nr:hypothetical protein PSDVSF_12130 [Pseudodesulfovibrio sediminis]